MRRWIRNIRHYLTSRTTAPRRTPRQRARLQLEYLEDRTVLSTANFTGTLTGLAFLDAKGTGTFATGDLTMPGVKVVLDGTLTTPLSSTVSAASWLNGVVTITTAAENAVHVGSVVTISGMTPAAYNGTFTVTKVLSLTSFTYAHAASPGIATAFGTATETGATATTTTNAGGTYTFANVLPGTYTVTGGPVSGLIDSKSPTETTPSIVLGAGQTLSNNLAFTGKLAPTAITMALFLTETISTGSSFGPVSTTPALVNSRPDNTPTFTQIAAQSVNVNAAPTQLDLAGHFSDPDNTNSQVTFNITDGTTPMKIVLNLFDSQDPQTVANFFDYINSGAYNNSIFHRLVTSGLDILQGGALALAPVGTTQTVTLAGAVANKTQFTLTYTNPAKPAPNNTETTTPITFTGDSATDSLAVQNALAALTSIGTGNVTVTEPSSSSTGGVFTIAFGGTLGKATQIQLTGDVTTTTPPGTTPPTLHTKLDTGLSAIPILSPGSAGVPTEFAKSNTAGTIAMALSGQPSDPSSGTDQFFFNIGNNAATLDSQKFTVFGQIASISTGTLATLNTTPTKDLTNAYTSNFPTAALQNVPLKNYNGGSTTFPGDITPSNFVRINSVTVNKRDEFLTYSVVSNSNPGLVTPTITNEWLTLKYATGQTGTATIVVKATDRFGASVTQQVTVTVNGPTVTGVHIASNDPNNQNVTSLTATPTSTDTNSSATVTYTYQWLRNGTPITGVASATTQTLDLASLAGSNITIAPNDTFAVEVTPKDSSITGPVFTSRTVTLATVSPSITLSLPTISNLTLLPSNPTTTTTLTANVTASDPQSLPLTYTYVWTDTTTNTTLRTASATANTSDTLNLGTKTVSVGDVISVSVTANNGVIDSKSSATSVTLA